MKNPPSTASRALSPRESQCLNAAAQGFVSAEIAEQIGLSARTVDHHIANAMRKLGARTRAAAVAHLSRLQTLGEE